MNDRLSRAFAGDLEVRSSGDGRTVVGIVAPFDQVARVSDGGPAYDECFVRGAFVRSISERGDRIKLLSQHDSRSNPLGRATLLREDAAGLYGEFRISATQAGDEALELLRDGALDAFSIGFSGISARRERGVTVRTEVRIRECSLVSLPAYEGARVLAVRSADKPSLTIARRRLDIARLALIEQDPHV
jgi:HK97 family phage prohead protease